jgi:hypothetical protein
LNTVKIIRTQNNPNFTSDLQFELLAKPIATRANVLRTMFLKEDGSVNIKHLDKNIINDYAVARAQFVNMYNSSTNAVYGTNLKTYNDIEEINDNIREINASFERICNTVKYTRPEYDYVNCIHLSHESVDFSHESQLGKSLIERRKNINCNAKFSEFLSRKTAVDKPSRILKISSNGKNEFEFISGCRNVKVKKNFFGANYTKQYNDLNGKKIISINSDASLSESDTEVISVAILKNLLQLKKEIDTINNTFSKSNAQEALLCELNKKQAKYSESLASFAKRNNYDANIVSELIETKSMKFFQCYHAKDILAKLNVERSNSLFKIFGIDGAMARLNEEIASAQGSQRFNKTMRLNSLRNQESEIIRKHHFTAKNTANVSNIITTKIINRLLSSDQLLLANPANYMDADSAHNSALTMHLKTE